MKSVNRIVLAVMLVLSVNHAFADGPPSIVLYGNICDIQANDAAGSWRNTCVELAGMDGVVTVEERQACTQQGQQMYKVVFNACISNLFQVYPPVFAQ